MENRGSGIVVAIDGRTSTVRLDSLELTGASVLRCGLKGTMRGASEGRSRVAVGDRVTVEPTGAGEGRVVAIAPRTTRLARGRGREEQVIASNVEQIAIVASVREPDWRPGFVDRVICAAEKGGLSVLVVANKADLLGTEGDGDLARRVRRDLAVFRKLGYDAIETSTMTGAGIDALREELQGRITVFAGQSGVGKSSLLNVAAPGLALHTGDVCRATRKGRHTTTSVALLSFPGGGYVLDTPGVRSFALYELEPAETATLFVELSARAPSCRFRDCRHTGEPDCAVRSAVEAGEIDARRYASYRRLLESLDLDEDERDD